MPTDAKELLKECAALIGACKPHFADPAITEVEWKQKDRPVEVSLPANTPPPTIPDDLKKEIEWKKATSNKLAVLKFKKALTQDLAEKAKTIFGSNEEVANAIDNAFNKSQSGDNDKDGPSGGDD
jgi:hypothetical protein